MITGLAFSAIGSFAMWVALFSPWAKRSVEKERNQRNEQWLSNVGPWND